MHDLGSLGNTILGAFLVVIWTVLLAVIIVGFGGVFLIFVNAVVTPKKGKTDGEDSEGSTKE